MGKERVYRSVSLQDLVQAGIRLEVSNIEGTLRVTRGTKHGKPLDLDELPDMLYVIGVAKTEAFEVMPKAMHRKFDGKLADDYRLVGLERKDKEWISSGYASEEAVMSSSKMHDMDIHTRQMKSGGER